MKTLFTILLLLALYIATTSAKCVPLYQPEVTRTPLHGQQTPICNRYLQALGIDHVWVEDAAIQEYTTDPAQCASAVTFLDDRPAMQLSNFFNETFPSNTCQRVLIMAMCLAEYKPCDPVADAVTYTTASRQRPCKEYCQLYKDSLDETLCTNQERAILKDNGFDLQSTLSVPQFDCNDLKYWAPSTAPTWPPATTAQQQSCIAPVVIPEHKPHARCEEYKPNTPNGRGFCSGVFSTSTMVYIPADTTQDELEDYISQYANLWYGLAYNVNIDDCQGAQLRAFCTAVFHECMTAGVDVATYDATTDTFTTVHHNTNAAGKKVIKSLTMPPPLSTCHYYRMECKESVYYQWLFNHYNDTTPINPATGDNGLDAYINSFFPECDAALYRPITCINATSAASLAAFGAMSPVFGSNQYAAAYQNEVIALNTIGVDVYVDQVKQEQGITDVPQMTNVYYLSRNFAGAANQYISTIPYQSSCPAPLIIPAALRDDPVGITQGTVFGGICSVACPPISLMYSQGRLDTLSTVIDAAISFVFATMSLLLITMLVFSSQRKKRLLFYYVSTYWVVTTILFVAVRLGKQSQYSSIYEMACKDDINLYHMTGWGLFQSLVLVYFLLASTAWWLCQVCDLFARLILGHAFHRGGRRHFKRKLAFHLFSWGTPMLSIIPLLMAEQLGYDPYLPYSWITLPNGLTSKPIALSTWFFFLPIILMAAAGLIMITVVIFFLIRYEQRAADPVEEAKAAAQEVHEPLPTELPDPTTLTAAPPDLQLAPAGAEVITSIIPEGDERDEEVSIAIEEAPAPVAAPTPRSKAEEYRQKKNAEQLQALATGDPSKATPGVITLVTTQDVATKGMQRFHEQFNKTTSCWTKFQQTVKLFGFVLMMVAFIVLLFVHEINASQHRSSWDRTINEYAQCIVEESNIGSPAGACRESLLATSVVMKEKDILLHVFGLIIPAIVSFLLHFVFSGEVLGLWLGLFAFGCNVECLKPFAREDTVTGGLSTDISSDWSADRTTQRTGRNRSSEGSDIFNGGSTLNKPERRGSRPLTGTRAPNNTGKHGSDANIPIYTSSVTTKSFAVSQEEAMKRRKTLFNKNPSFNARTAYRISQANSSVDASTDDRYGDLMGSIEMSETQVPSRVDSGISSMGSFSHHQQDQHDPFAPGGVILDQGMHDVMERDQEIEPQQDRLNQQQALAVLQEEPEDLAGTAM